MGKAKESRSRGAPKAPGLGAQRFGSRTKLSECVKSGSRGDWRSDSCVYSVPALCELALTFLPLMSELMWLNFFQAGATAPSVTMATAETTLSKKKRCRTWFTGVWVGLQRNHYVLDESINRFVYKISEKHFLKSFFKVSPRWRLQRSRFVQPTVQNSAKSEAGTSKGSTGYEGSFMQETWHKPGF